MSVLNLQGVDKSYLPKAAAVKGIDLEVMEGELLALLGESGSGKTTLLRLIAGLEQPDLGSIEINQSQVAGNLGFVEPQNRPVGLVFQDYALFPHMTVLKNIKFGLRKWKVSEAQIRCEEVLQMVNLQGLESRYPHQLSGGQQQRVAIARALAPRPKILLLDEPFSNLDTLLKDQVREEVKSIIKRSGTTAILVTHDVKDALSMADRIALMKDGMLQQIDRPDVLYNYPSNSYVAAFLGKVNLIPATVTAGQLVTEIGNFPTTQSEIKSGLLCLRPEHLTIMSSEGPGICGEIQTVQFYGDHQQLSLKTGTCQLWCNAGRESRYHQGQLIYLSITADHLHIIGSKSET